MKETFVLLPAKITLGKKKEKNGGAQERIYLHAFTDGRETPPRAAAHSGQFEAAKKVVCM